MSDHDATTIQLAADFIFEECTKLGMPISYCASLSIARKLWDYWSRPGGVQRHIPPGEIAHRFRERYEALSIDIVELPLVNSRG